ncbi:site-specific integrase [Microbulbifer sp. CAU 1566]|nr:site-specific integrase [Microbulbifer sp. CAU 1566]MCK7596119.1 site-specific integrase [Microbulbifer sp. CAU 1566]
MAALFEVLSMAKNHKTREMILKGKVSAAKGKLNDAFDQLSVEALKQLHGDVSDVGSELREFFALADELEGKKLTLESQLRDVRERMQIQEELKEAVRRDLLRKEEAAELGIPIISLEANSRTHSDECTSIRLSEAMTRFSRSKREEGVRLAGHEKGPKGSPWAGYTPYLRLFLAVAGDKATTDISLSDVRKYKEVVQRFPNANQQGTASLLEYDYETLKFKVSLEVILDKTEESGLKLLSSGSIKEYFLHLTTFLIWLSEENDYLSREVSSKAKNIIRPSKVMARAQGNRSESYKKFSSDQLSAIFRSPYFDTSKLLSPHQNARRLAPSDFWLPLIALFTGARGNEIAQLHVSDLCLVEGVWCININEEEDKRVKCQSSVRQVPIHERLIRIGLLDFHAYCVHAGQVHLFPELHGDGERRLKPYKKWGQWFRRNILQRYAGIVPGSGEVFHSFRGNLITELLRKGVQEELRKQLAGHSIGNDSHSKYTKGWSLAQRREAINKATYDEVEFGHLEWGAYKRVRIDSR